MVYEEKKNKTLLLIPAYNEEKNIAQVISGIRNLFLLLDILVIDDGSSDSTPQVAKNCGVDVASLPFNLGYGVALQTGYKYALRYGYDSVIQTDADGQHSVESIQALLNQINSGLADIVIGSRFLNKGSYKLGFIRNVGIKLFSAIVSHVTRQKITDPTSGFQALNQKVLRFYCQDIFPSDFPDADMLILSHSVGLRIKEVAVTMYQSPSGKRSMHSGLTSIYYIFKMFLSITVTLMRKPPKMEAQ